MASLAQFNSARIEGYPDAKGIIFKPRVPSISFSYMRAGKEWRRTCRVFQVSKDGDTYVFTVPADVVRPDTPQFAK